jgi:formamidopyrimidine-DNA glycosylase
MPELPEVETVTRALRPRLVGRRLLGVVTHTAKLRRPLVWDSASIAGRTIVTVRRRAKYILVELSDLQVILIHLGMTGSCRVVPANEPLTKHEHVVWLLDNGETWRYRDPRRFGVAELHAIAAPGGEPDCLADHGPEPLDDQVFNAWVLRAACAGHERPIKPFLLDPSVVVGVGNIYASEALHRAGIRPTRTAASLSLARCGKLVAAIQEVLQAAIAAGGTTVADFRAPDGSEGWFTRELRVYERAGQPCLGCGKGPIQRLVQTGRSSYFCPHCQR